MFYLIYSRCIVTVWDEYVVEISKEPEQLDTFLGGGWGSRGEGEVARGRWAWCSVQELYDDIFDRAERDNEFCDFRGTTKQVFADSATAVLMAELCGASPANRRGYSVLSVSPPAFEAFGVVVGSCDNNVRILPPSRGRWAYTFCTHVLLGPRKGYGYRREERPRT